LIGTTFIRIFRKRNERNVLTSLGLSSTRDHPLPQTVSVSIAQETRETKGGFTMARKPLPFPELEYSWTFTEVRSLEDELREEIKQFNTEIDELDLIDSGDWDEDEYADADEHRQMCLWSLRRHTHAIAEIKKEYLALREEIDRED
jgi:hypothetical protein